MIFFVCLLVYKAFSDETLVFNMSKFKASINSLDYKENKTCAQAMTKSLFGRVWAKELVETNKMQSRLCKSGYALWSDTPCLLDQSEFCNGHSACLTDECECTSTNLLSFNCGDKSGCISIDQVCDGTKDCFDGSDECVCADYVNCVEGLDQGVCDNADKRRCLMTNETKEESSAIRQSNQCFPFPVVGVRQIQEAPNFASIEDCINKCPNYTHHCKRMQWVAQDCDLKLECSGLYYDCNKGGHGTVSSVNDLAPILELTKVCDGKPDCWNGADEESCFNRFLCNDNNRSIHISRTCDLVKDCKDGSDECQSCTVSLLYSEKHLIGYPFLRYWIFFQTLLIILANTWAFIEHFGIEKKTKTGQIDKCLCMQMCVYDTMMSLYLGIVSLKNLQFRGSYCVHDSYWRTSHVCDFCGAIFSFSSHGSMLTAALMGLSRAYTVVYTFTDMSYRGWVCLCIGVNIVNFLNSILPILPLEYLDEFFTVEVFFDENPISPKATKEQLQKVYMLYKNVSSLTSSDSSVKGMLKELNAMTSRSIFDVSRRLGFYGKSPLCVQNLFSIEPKLVVMKSVYVFVILVIITMVVLSYAVIVYETKKRVVNVNAEGDAVAAERRAFLSFKVTALICTQMACWLPIILATATTLLYREIPPEFYEVAAIVSLPIKSMFNPICHSSVLKKIYQFVTRKVQQLVIVIIRVIRPTREDEMESA